MKGVITIKGLWRGAYNRSNKYLNFLKLLVSDFLRWQRSYFLQSIFVCMAIFSLFTRPAYALQPPSISQADIQMRLGELYCHQGEYKKANAAYKQAFVLGGDADDVYFGLGYCHVKRLQSEDIHSGNNYHTDQALAHKRIKQRKKALSIFSLITPNSRNKTDVDKWAAYLKAEITLAQDELNRDNQLGFYDEVCTYSIYDLYDSQIFTGRFETEETDCIPYQTQYRTLFRANWQD